MSFINAFVKYSETGKEYPLDCLRDDLVPGDEVLTRRSDGKLASGVVVRTEFLNWQCGARIECKLSEARINADGLPIPPSNSPFVLGLTTNEALVAALKGRGWVPQKRGNVHRYVLAFTNDVQTAFILIRSNGVDLQLLDSKLEGAMQPYVVQQLSVTQGKFVRHHFSHCGFNLYEGILRFAQAFEINSGNYDRYFVSVGASDKRTEALKEDSKQRRAERSKESSLYDALSLGDGEPVYLSDGVWITAGGGVHDWGR